MLVNEANALQAGPKAAATRAEQARLDMLEMGIGEFAACRETLMERAMGGGG